MFFLVFLTSSFNILSHLQPLVKHFFILFFLCCLLSQTALIVYHVWFLLSSTFFYLFSEVFASDCLSLTACIYYHFSFYMSTPFFNFFTFFVTIRYCSHSSQTLAVWLRKNVIQVFAGFFCEAKFQISLRKLLFTGLPVNSNNYSAISEDLAASAAIKQR